MADIIEYTYENDIFSISNKTSTFYDEKDKNKFIKNIEKIIRGSIEYTQFITYLREHLELNYCTILNNLDTKSISIQLHHTPFTLYDIVNIVINKYEYNKYLFNTFTIASEVIDLHYANLIGLTPLSDTMHQLVHSNQIQIDKNSTIGNINKFIEIYKPYLNPDHLDKYTQYCNNNNTIDPNSLYDSDKQIDKLNKITQINQLSIK